MATALGEKIKRLRKGKGLTLEQLADRTESSKSYIWELENKNVPRPSAEKTFENCRRTRSYYGLFAR